MTLPLRLASSLGLPSGARLENRIVKAAMSEVLADRVTGAPDAKLVRLYEGWGKGGAGMLLTGNVMISTESRGELGQVVVDDETHLEVLREWAQAAQANGSALWMQINHAGRQTPRSIADTCLAPSAIPMRRGGGLFAKPIAATDAQIRGLVRGFATTAAVAKKAGFAGVQIHGAHGYLVNQFLSPLSNTRGDAWGGDPERRMRFLLEIVRAIRAEVGPDFPVGVKLNSADFQRGGFTEEESMQVVVALEKEGIDLLEISGGTYESPAMMGSGDPGAPKKKQRASTAAREAYFLDYARKVRAITKTPLLLTGGMRTAATMERVIADGEVDLVGLGRPLAYEPDLPKRLLSGAAEAAITFEAHVSVRLFDDLLQAAFAQAQLARMARGLDPDLTISPWRVIVSTILHGYLWNPYRRARTLPPKPLATGANPA